MWDKEEALNYLAKIRPLFDKYGFKAEMVGSVAKKGVSKHDLDIKLTAIREDADFEPLYETLKGDFDGDIYRYTDDAGKPIDIFFGEGKYD